MSRLAAIGLGANLPSRAGTPEQTVAAAADELAKLAEPGSVIRRSSLYRTEPVGFRDQPAFVNAAVTLETELEAEALLDALLAMERRFGRDRTSELRNHPRTLDADLLLLGDLVVDLPGLKLPHPAMAERRFVLAPLAEIAPDVVHPTLKKSMTELLRALAAEGPNRIESVQKLAPAAVGPER